MHDLTNNGTSAIRDSGHATLTSGEHVSHQIPHPNTPSLQSNTQSPSHPSEASAISAAKVEGAVRAEGSTIKKPRKPRPSHEGKAKSKSSGSSHSHKDLAANAGSVAGPSIEGLSFWNRQSSSIGGWIGPTATSGQNSSTLLSALPSHRSIYPEIVVPFALPRRRLGATSSGVYPPHDGVSTNSRDGTPSSSGSGLSDNDLDSDTSNSSDGSSSDTSASETEDPQAHLKTGRVAKYERQQSRRRDRNLLFIQSLRQSRLFNMTSILPVHSYRNAKGQHVYQQEVSAEHLHGLDPTKRDTCILAPICDAELQIGPHRFRSTKVYELRPASKRHPASAQEKRTGNSKSSSHSMLAATQKNSASKVSQKKALSSRPQSSIESPVTVNTSHQSPLSSSANSPVPSSSSMNRLHQPPTRSPTTNATPISSPSQPRFGSPPAPPVAVPASVDPVLVTRVNARAAHSPHLRALLQVAAKGAADGEQLRMLSVVIQQVTAEMEAEGLKVRTPQMHHTPPRTSLSPVANRSGGAQSVAASPTSDTLSAGQTPSSNIVTESCQTPPLPPTNAASFQESKRDTDRRITPSTPEPNFGPGAKGQPSSLIAIDVVEQPQTATGNVSTPKAGETQPSTASRKKPSGKEHISSMQYNGPVVVADTLPPTHRPPVVLIELAESPGAYLYLPLWSSTAARRKKIVPAYLHTGDIASEELRLSEEEDHKKLSEETCCTEVELQFLGPVEKQLSRNPTATSKGNEGEAPDISARVESQDGRLGLDAGPSHVSSGEIPTSALPDGVTVSGTRPDQEGGQRTADERENIQEGTLYMMSLTLQSLDEGDALWQLFERMPGTKSFDVKGHELDAAVLQPRPEMSDHEAGAETGAQRSEMDLSSHGQSRADIGNDSLTEEHLHSTIGPSNEAMLEGGRLHVERLRKLAAEAITRLPPHLFIDTTAALPSGLVDHLESDTYQPTVRQRSGPHSRNGSAGQQVKKAASGKRPYHRRQKLPFEPASGPETRQQPPSALPSATGLGDHSNSGIIQSPQIEDRPRKKRNVATHNADGSIKACRYCGATDPPTWRRGPAGPGTLCNACGSRWKLGKLVIPEDGAARSQASD
ncbi:unnamed protein product [Sympodiomycopsis kandeliae]